MKQVLQNLNTGDTEVATVPAPAAQAGEVLIRSARSLVSAGTERMLVDFGKAGLVAKARQQPDKVRMVLDKARTDGVFQTIEAVRRKLDQPLPLGYCNAGTVIEVGGGVQAFKPGDRVASNGKHASFVSVPVNLCARIPDSVSDDEAAFTVLGAIALQGIRLAAPTLGECVVVTGLGLVGLMTVQLLVAQGCRVLGLDFDRGKLDLAEKFGAEVVDLGAVPDPLAAAEAFSRGRGVDAVLITASTTSSKPVHEAARMCRKRGRIVLVGVTGLELSRADFFEKELTFQVSCSYGPGRYDRDYEEKGRDYPAGFVRWTEQRNFEAVLDMMASGRLDVKPLISHRFPIAAAEGAYDLIAGDAPSLGVLIEYPGTGEPVRRVEAPLRLVRAEGRAVSFIGAGNYAASVLMPAFREAGAQLHTVVSAGGMSAALAARKFGFAEASTDTDAVLADEASDAVVIATRHNDHGRLAIAALRAGKHVFVEKPLALTLDEVDEIETLVRGPAADRLLMVGFNRRFSPHVRKMKQLLSGAIGPKAFVMTVNAGAIPGDHWTQDLDVGGGRIVGEACHFIDLLRHLAGCGIASASKTAMVGAHGDTATLNLTFTDGSIGTVHYFANGHKGLPKERLEAYVDGRVLKLDNFRKLAGHGWPGFTKMSLWRQDKGQAACASAFMTAMAGGGDTPVPVDELLEVSRIAIKLARD